MDQGLEGISKVISRRLLIEGGAASLAAYAAGLTAPLTVQAAEARFTLEDAIRQGFPDVLPAQPVISRTLFGGPADYEAHKREAGPDNVPGIDVVFGNMNAPVFSPIAGRVALSQYSDKLGGVVVIDGGIDAVYLGHMRKIFSPYTPRIGSFARLDVNGPKIDESTVLGEQGERLGILHTHFTIAVPKILPHDPDASGGSLKFLDSVTNPNNYANGNFVTNFWDGRENSAYWRGVDEIRDFAYAFFVPSHSIKREDGALVKNPRNYILLEILNFIYDAVEARRKEFGKSDPIVMQGDNLYKHVRETAQNLRIYTPFIPKDPVKVMSILEKNISINPEAAKAVLAFYGSLLSVPVREGYLRRLGYSPRS